MNSEIESETIVLKTKHELKKKKAKQETTLGPRVCDLHMICMLRELPPSSCFFYLLFQTLNISSKYLLVVNSVIAEELLKYHHIQYLDSVMNQC